MRIFRNIIAVLLLICSTTACAHNESSKKDADDMKDKKILVAYFSRADENYNVGYITEGNTKIIAKMIAEKTGADAFHIETVTPYPADYNECIDLAKRELNSKARPEIKGDASVEDYDVIFLGTPNWWGDMPMAVYTFIEKHDWNGKIIIPFATHEGSGMGGMDRKMQRAAEGSTMLNGLAIQGTVAQNQRDKAKAQVEKWLKTLNF